MVPQGCATFGIGTPDGQSAGKRRCNREAAAMRKLFKWVVVCALLAAPALGQAQGPSSYPDRPIRLVVAFVAGGATDTLARQISNDLKEALGQTVVVENRPAPNGYLAANHFAPSAPGGSTLPLGTHPLPLPPAPH